MGDSRLCCLIGQQKVQAKQSAILVDKPEKSRNLIRGYTASGDESQSSRPDRFYRLTVLPTLEREGMRSVWEVSPSKVHTQIRQYRDTGRLKGFAGPAYRFFAAAWIASYSVGGAFAGLFAVGVWSWLLWSFF